MPVPASPPPLLPPPHLHKRSHPSWPLRHRSCRRHRTGRRHRSCLCSRHPRRRKGSKHLAKPRAPAVVLRVLSKKRQIPQIDGCFSPPSPPLPPSPSTPCQPAIELEDEPPLQSKKSSPLLALQAPAPPQALSPRRAPSPLVLAPVSSPGTRSPAPAHPPAPSATQPAVTAPASGSGYTLVLIWCPFCKKNRINNRDFECYMCQEKRYYRSLQYEDE